MSALANAIGPMLAPPGAGRVERLARLVVVAVIAAMAVANVVWTLQTWPMGDVQIYWDAGERIRSGEPLYPGSGPFTSYRYAPWFAWAWALLTHLPYWLVALVWETALLAACIAVAIPFVRAGSTGRILALLLVPLLFAVSGGGNVQALLVAALLHGIDRRSGPVWIAIAASLRATPILFVGIYAARRQWFRFWTTMGLAALLITPMAFYNPEALFTEVAGREPGLLGLSPALYLAVAAASVATVLVLAWRRSRFTWTGAAAAAIVASPKLFAYDVTSMLAVRPNRDDRAIQREPPA